jgi:acetolactate synthase-1/2/3 large subunit
LTKRMVANANRNAEGIEVSRMMGSKALVEALKREGVKVIFGIPGGAIMPVYDALLDFDIRHILARHEQCAGHMADGYARASGSVGVCMATSGPGATNLVTAIATAYMDSSPIVAITGQVTRNMIGKDGFQEADIVGITTPITKYNYQVMAAKDIPRIVKEAFYIASTGRPGPVLMALPRDVQTEEDEIPFPKSVKLRGYNPSVEPHPLQVKRAAELLVQAERPMILAGGGIHISRAYEELLALAELLNAPVATTLMGKGCFPENHPLSLGGVGMHGTKEANLLILEADVLLAVGTRFSDRTTGRLTEFCPDAKIIHVDIDAAEIRKNAKVDVPIVADAKKAMKAIRDQILQMASRREPSLWLKRVRELKDQMNAETSLEGDSLRPKSIIKTLRRLLPEDAIVTTEVGQNQMWAFLHFQVIKPRTYITSGGLGTMGFGFPAALGAKVARPDVPVVDIAGDGSFIMTEQDLATSVMEDIPVTVLILNNSVLGMVAQWQRLFYNRRYSHVNLGGIPDFVKLAEAYGARGERAKSLSDLEEAITKAIRSDVTTVIDVPISPEENVFPMVPAGKALKEMIWE